MQWININVEVLDSERYLGEEPTERATWMALLRYCVGQENGGIIEGAGGWKERKCEQVLRCTKSEISVDCGLWEWDGENLIVWAYPIEKQEEVQKKRAAGSKGGRNSKRSRKSTPISSALSSALSKPISTPITEGKGREWNGMESTPLPPEGDGVSDEDHGFIGDTTNTLQGMWGTGSGRRFEIMRELHKIILECKKAPQSLPDGVEDTTEAILGLITSNAGEWAKYCRVAYSKPKRLRSWLRDGDWMHPCPELPNDPKQAPDYSEMELT